MPKLRALDVWTYNLQDGTSARFTFGSAEKTTSVWSRDGKMIALHFDPAVFRNTSKLRK